MATDVAPIIEPAEAQKTPEPDSPFSLSNSLMWMLRDDLERRRTIDRDLVQVLRDLREELAYWRERER